MYSHTLLLVLYWYILSWSPFYHILLGTSHKLLLSWLLVVVVVLCLVSVFSLFCYLLLLLLLLILVMSCYRNKNKIKIQFNEYHHPFTRL